MQYRTVKQIISQYVPSLAEMVENEEFSWGKLDKAYKKKVNQRIAVLASAPLEISFSANLYDVIEMAENGNDKASRILHFFDSLLYELQKNLPPEKVILLKSTLYSVLNHFDYSYLNFFGEIASLNQLLKSQLFQLDSLEYPLGNGNRADFRLYNINQKRFDLVEVLNIHINRTVSEDPGEFVAFLKKRLQDKAEAKGTPTDYPFLIILPVIWAEASELKKISGHYKAGIKSQLPDALEPVAYVNYYNDTGIVKPVFGSLSSIFDIQFE